MRNLFQTSFPFDFLIMSTGLRVIVYFVCELAWAKVGAGQYLIKMKIGFENHPKVENSLIGFI